MCLILFAYQTHPDYHLVLAANRDESYARPTQALHRWPDPVEIYAGKDEQEGGAWLGITKTGRFAAITNYREIGKKTSSLSRGKLTTDFLLGKQSPAHYLKKIAHDQHLYNGFNLILGEGENIFYYSNRQHQIKQLTPGVHGLSNHLLNSSWPKVDHGKYRLTQLLKQPQFPTTSQLVHLLSDTLPAETESLPDTGIGMSAEKMLSPLFIKSAVYGTRASTILTISKQGKVELTENCFGPHGSEEGSNSCSFTLSPQALS
ncbi:MAG: NRDE family protein [Gammaproteobacteria bacterium]|nr:NRDE family protein [Gammaproteobacteria bacterium]